MRSGPWSKNYKPVIFQGGGVFENKFRISNGYAWKAFNGIADGA